MHAGKHEWFEGLKAWRLESLEVAKVETWALSPLQFSTLVELEPGNLECVCVRLSAAFPGNRSKDFSETWSEVKGGWMGNGDTAVFSVKTHAH